MAFKSIKSLHFVREKNLIKWLIVIMIPLFIMTVVAVFDNDFRSYFPSFEAKSCLLGSNYFTKEYDIIRKFQLHLYYTIESYLLTNFVLNSLLMWFIYLLRDIQAEFSMNHELKVLTFVQIAVDFIIFFFLIVAPKAEISSSNNLQYIMSVRGLVLLWVTAVQPLRASYSANAIIPFPINEECIKTLEMALLMPTSANYFYEYLETLCGSERNKDALVYFGLYADIRTYLRLLEDQADEDS